mmetsp:Transcript_1211/g.1095  ORF Transcript_1211/g.1095 Transcript_1211/m.1095 type:complete len:94 (+) Transcript_1211:627-908(+)
MEQYEALKKKIHLLEDVLRHIREKSYHKINSKYIKKLLQEDFPSTSEYEIPPNFGKYQGNNDNIDNCHMKFLDNLIKNNEDDDIVNIEDEISS